MYVVVIPVIPLRRGLWRPSALFCDPGKPPAMRRVSRHVLSANLHCHSAGPHSTTSGSSPARKLAGWHSLQSCVGLKPAFSTRPAGSTLPDYKHCTITLFCETRPGGECDQQCQDAHHEGAPAARMLGLPHCLTGGQAEPPAYCAREKLLTNKPGHASAHPKRSIPRDFCIPARTALVLMAAYVIFLLVRSRQRFVSVP